MTCEEIRQHAAGLVTLPDEDPELRSAVQHANSCQACTQALAQARRLIGMLDSLPAPEPPSDAVLARVSAKIIGELEQKTSKTPLGLAATVPLGWAAIVLLEKFRAPDAWGQSIGMVVLATILAAIGYRYERAATLAAVIGSLALSLITGDGTVWAARIGMACTALELMSALLPVAATAIYIFAKGTRQVGLLVPAAAMGALAGQGALHLTCPAHRELPHLLVFHSGGVVLALLLAWMVSHFLTVRPKLHETSRFFHD